MSACKRRLQDGSDVLLYTFYKAFFKPIFVVYLTAFELREIYFLATERLRLYTYTVQLACASEKFDTIKIQAVNMAEPPFDSGSLIMPITNINAREIITPSLVVGRCAVATQTLLMDALVQKNVGLLP